MISLQFIILILVFSECYSREERVGVREALLGADNECNVNSFPPKFGSSRWQETPSKKCNHSVLYGMASSGTKYLSLLWRENFVQPLISLGAAEETAKSPLHMRFHPYRNTSIVMEPFDTSSRPNTLKQHDFTVKEHLQEYLGMDIGEGEAECVNYIVAVKDPFSWSITLKRWMRNHQGSQSQTWSGRLNNLSEYNSFYSTWLEWWRESPELVTFVPFPVLIKENFDAARQLGLKLGLATVDAPTGPNAGQWELGGEAIRPFFQSTKKFYLGQDFMLKYEGWEIEKVGQQLDHSLKCYVSDFYGEDIYAASWKA